MGLLNVLIQRNCPRLWRLAHRYCCRNCDCVQTCVLLNRLQLFKLAVRNGCPFTPQRILESAALLGNNRLVRYIVESPLNAIVTERVVCAAAFSGDKHCMDYTINVLGFVPRHTCSILAANGSLDLMKWLFQKWSCSIKAKLALGPNELCLAAYFGHAELMKYIYQVAHIKCNTNVLRAIVIRGFEHCGIDGPFVSNDSLEQRLLLLKQFENTDDNRRRLKQFGHSRNTIDFVKCLLYVNGFDKNRRAGRVAFGGESVILYGQGSLATIKI